jgi:hypothetical protein
MDEKVYVTTGDTLQERMLATEEVRKPGSVEAKKRRNGETKKVRGQTTVD